MKNAVWKTGLAAWKGLGQCGLEPNGRDQDFAEMLRIALNPGAEDLTEALSGCTTEQFVRTFLATGAPYVQMLRGIMRMFERAEAKEGKQHWKIEFEGYVAELEHFKHWERVVSRLGTQLDCPELSSSAWWRLLEILRVPPVTERQGDVPYAFWDTRARMAHLPEPEVNCEPWMRDLWMIVSRAEHVLSGFGLDLVSAREGEWPRHPDPSRELFYIGNLCHLQHDYGISQVAAAYSALLRDIDAQRTLSNTINAELDGVPRRWIWIEADVEDLKSFLALPVWEKRHEFFAAWVASEMIDVFREQKILVHSDGGKITFPFRETRVASIANAGWTLISERRTSLKNPLGAGRAAGAQPDYGWWKQAAPKLENCGLVVEVKHYKKAALRPWMQVLTDYANAHPDAAILLVNYGPEGRAGEEVSTELSGRCHVIGELRPDSAASVQRFRRLVSEHVKLKEELSRAIVLDVSASMGLLRRQLGSQLQAIAEQFACREIIAVDETIVDRFAVHLISDQKISMLSRQRTEQLAGPLMQLLDTYASVLLVSDEQGGQSIIDDTRFRVNVQEVTGLDADLTTFEVRRAANGQE